MLTMSLSNYQYLLLLEAVLVQHGLSASFERDIVND